MPSALLRSVLVIGIVIFLTDPEDARAAALQVQMQAESPSVADTLDLRPVPADTYADDPVRDLIERARSMRGQAIEGIESYETTLRERVYAGLTGRMFRRERGLFEQEQVARIRWSSDGDRVVRWIGARREIPLGGDAIAGREGGANEAMLRALENDLSRSANPAAMAFDPGDDRLGFGSNWALHPLADTAHFRYRYYSGDTLRVRLPEQNRVITLVEARVEPRESSFDLVAGSLWFDDDSGALVRAAFRPARPFDLEIDEPEDASDVPRFLRPIRAEIRYIAIDYSLQEFRWWLPYRFAFEGEAQVGSLFRIPITFEWTVGGYAVNATASELVADGPLPPGWTRSERRVQRGDEPPRYVTVIVPPGDSLVAAPELSETLIGGTATAFSDDEIRDIRAELDELIPRSFALRPRISWGTEDGLTRFNRVEGLSVGARGELPLHPTYTLSSTVRVGLSDNELSGELSVERGPSDRPLRLTGYRRLTHGADRSNPLNLPNSLVNLVIGGDRSPFFRATGVELETSRESRRVRTEARLFHEGHDPAFRNTDFTLLGLVRDDTAAVNILAREGSVTGMAAGVRWWSGLDPSRLRGFGTLRAEVGAGELSYQRVQASLGAMRPIPFGLAAAVEVSGGTVFGDETPIQKLFYGGDAPALRAADGPLMDESFWTTRIEVANDLPLARLVLFGDLGWAGPRREFSVKEYSAAVGIGASLLDGIVRLDLSRGIRGRSDFYFRAYWDGLF